jgi:hypothetical protein
MDPQTLQANACRSNLDDMAQTAASRQRRSSGSPRRGRPVGSIKLTADMEAIITSYIEAGAADYIAAEAAGIDARTFRDYLARGRKAHSSRAPTPQLVRFEKNVMQAKARARAAREIEAAEHHVPFWLTHMARSRPGREGWTDPMEDEQDGEAPDLYQPSLEEAAETLRVLIEAGVLSLDEHGRPSRPSEQATEATDA